MWKVGEKLFSFYSYCAGYKLASKSSIGVEKKSESRLAYSQAVAKIGAVGGQYCLTFETIWSAETYRIFEMDSMATSLRYLEDFIKMVYSGRPKFGGSGI